MTEVPRAVRLLSDDYVIWRGADGKVDCAIDECPDRAARLSQGWFEAGNIVCPNHGWAFDGTGACTRIPKNDPDKPIPPGAHLVDACRGDIRSGLAVRRHAARRYPDPARGR